MSSVSIFVVSMVSSYVKQRAGQEKTGGHEPEGVGEVRQEAEGRYEEDETERLGRSGETLEDGFNGGGEEDVGQLAGQRLQPQLDTEHVHRQHQQSAVTPAQYKPSLRKLLTDLRL